MFECEHKNVAFLMHADGCHFFKSSYKCNDCNAVITTYDERDFSSPYSENWAIEECNRCNELMSGAERVSKVEFS